MEVPELKPLTLGQATFFAWFAGSAALWTYAEALARRPCRQRLPLVVDKQAFHAAAAPPDTKNAAGLAAATTQAAALRLPIEGAAGATPARQDGFAASVWQCGLVRCVRLQRDALVECRDVLRWCTELGAILTWFYIADRTPALPRGPKAYSRDVFGFVCLCIAGAAAVSGPKETCKADGKDMAKTHVLSRHQTEEWKGWMQILFLLYHYFNATELYNAIRVFIAAYVWMTGYGNFRYYASTADFTLGRVLQSLWRLNFLAAACCIVLNNSYMLYYICPLHTLFTLAVYGVLAIKPAANASPSGIAVKLAASVAVVALVWEVPGVFDAVWEPLKPMLQYIDPRRPPPSNTLHEWHFRSGLDRYVWIHGMLCGALQPAAQAALQRLDAAPRGTRLAVRTTLTACALATLFVWTTTLFPLPKPHYNALHPYTSWLPITAWIVLRNVHPALRARSSALLAWCGTITLETYIAQSHTWMATNLADGQPKAVLAVVPSAPLVSFGVASGVALVLSRRLFVVTAALRDVVVPHAPREPVTDVSLMARNVVAGVGVGAGLCAVAWMGVAAVTRI